MILLVKMTFDLGGVITECERVWKVGKEVCYNFGEEVRSRTLLLKCLN